VSRDVSMYVEDMLEAARRVVTYTAGLDRAAFGADLKTVDTVVRNLEILGEAAKNVPAGVRALETDIAWRRIAGMRDVLAHAYFGIDGSDRVERRGCRGTRTAAST
jgi:uncharacterized protein with HEPN domain